MQTRLNQVVEEFDTIGKRLRWTRKERKLTQQDLASRSGVKQSDISKIERDEIQRPTGLLALARALRCNPDWLDTGDGDWLVEAQMSDLATALSTLHDTISATGGIARARLMSSLQYFLEHPNEWREVARSIENDIPPKPSGETLPTAVGQN